MSQVTYPAPLRQCRRAAGTLYCVLPEGHDADGSPFPMCFHPPTCDIAPDVRAPCGIAEPKNGGCGCKSCSATLRMMDATAEWVRSIAKKCARSIPSVRHNCDKDALPGSDFCGPHSPPTPARGERTGEAGSVDAKPDPEREFVLGSLPWKVVHQKAWHEGQPEWHVYGGKMSTGLVIIGVPTKAHAEVIVEAVNRAPLTAPASSAPPKETTAVERKSTIHSMTDAEFALLEAQMNAEIFARHLRGLVQAMRGTTTVRVWSADGVEAKLRAAEDFLADEDANLEAAQAALQAERDELARKLAEAEADREALIKTAAYHNREWVHDHAKAVKRGDDAEVEMNRWKQRAERAEADRDAIRAELERMRPHFRPDATKQVKELWQRGEDMRLLAVQRYEENERLQADRDRLKAALEKDLALGGGTAEWREVVACVDAFRAVMLEKLAKNQHKGNRAGWWHDYPDALLDRVREETRELAKEVKGDRYGHRNLPALVREAADVANMAMMVADSARALMNVGDFAAAFSAPAATGEES